MKALVCSGCGAPLTPDATAVRVRCDYCGTTTEITTEGATQIARQLQALGIRVPEKTMTIAEIQADIARRNDMQRRDRNRTLIMMAVLMVLLFGFFSPLRRSHARRRRFANLSQGRPRPLPGSDVEPM